MLSVVYLLIKLSVPKCFLMFLVFSFYFFSCLGSFVLDDFHALKKE